MISKNRPTILFVDYSNDAKGRKNKKVHGKWKYLWSNYFPNFAIPSVPLSIALMGLQVEHQKLSWSSQWWLCVVACNEAFKLWLWSLQWPFPCHHVLQMFASKYYFFVILFFSFIGLLFFILRSFSPCNSCFSWVTLGIRYFSCF